MGSSLNGLAAVGVSAVGGIEPLGAFGEGNELIAGAVEGLNVFVEILEMQLEEVEYVVAGRLPLAPEIQNRSDLGEGEAGGLGVANKPEPADGFTAVVTVTVGSAIRRGQDPDVLVVTDGLGVDTDLLGKLSNFHKSIITPLTFHSDGRCSL